MKNLFFILFIGFSILVNGQKYANREFTLFNYDISIDDDFREKIEAVEGSLLTQGRYEEKKQEKLIGSLKDYTYSKFTRRATNELLYFFLPVNSFQKKFKYDPYNYPTGSITRALKYGSSKYYYKLDLTIEEADIDEEIEHEKVIPIVKLTFTIYNSKGYAPINKIEGYGRDSIPMKTDASILNGLTLGNKSSKGDSLNLAHLIDDAINEIVEELK